ncbi:MAG: hypothetical protein A3C02_04025 [Candidatus Andersenbacteria bacterium RIFCSPHIGHO2_02_FULL_45_11]|nr:MAG: hypothetical protein A2805_00740 [Candidatus Andersenbacteria bacterium RIFCSPHIGHO2_01_FULL_46_36]OGY33397.1 MAG: hypothetical protein A3C02_04025 [Candidatus Andersenbacteria bacterium RIFCSPHIGHO2_02_FULL_45_11]
MKSLIYYSIVGSSTVLCIVASFFLHMQVREIRDTLALSIRELEIAPTQESQARILKKELESIEQKLQQVSLITISQDEIVGVIDKILLAGKESGVSVQVPQVHAGTAKPGVLQDVRIRMNAIGSPSALVAFMYRLEHVPYIIRVASWNLDTTRQSAPGSFAANVPADTSKSKPPSGSLLAVEAIISILQK